MSTTPDVASDTGRGESSGRAVSGRVTRLLLELQQYAKLTEVDAHRAAFIALALQKGWSKARIARYLGISRARVGQKVEKLEDYVYENKRLMPTLQAALRNANVARAAVESVDSRSVSFPQDSWDDADFAQGMLGLVS